MASGGSRTKVVAYDMADIARAMVRMEVMSMPEMPDACWKGEAVVTMTGAHSGLRKLCQTLRKRNLRYYVHTHKRAYCSTQQHAS